RGLRVSFDLRRALRAAGAHQATAHHDVGRVGLDVGSADRALRGLVARLLLGHDRGLVGLLVLGGIGVEAAHALLAAELVHAVVVDDGLRVGINALVGHHQAGSQRVRRGRGDDLLLDLGHELGRIGLERRLALGAAELHLRAIELLVGHAREDHGDCVLAELLTRHGAGLEGECIATERLVGGGCGGEGEASHRGEKGAGREKRTGDAHAKTPKGCRLASAEDIGAPALPS
ncbi:MAG: hypothetical protein ACK55I_27125, partial [bacterium]